ncbi:hypothetical protein GCM10019815_04380 [Pediococcus damnosus]
MKKSVKKSHNKRDESGENSRSSRAYYDSFAILNRAKKSWPRLIRNLNQDLFTYI